MKEKTKHEIRQAIETLAIGIICSVWVLSMHQSCSKTVDKLPGKKASEKTEIKKVQELKNDTIKTFKLEQRVR